jgi:hypothetical protein
MVGISSVPLAPEIVVTHHPEDIVSIVLMHRGIRAFLGPKPSANNVMVSHASLDGS